MRQFQKSIYYLILVIVALIPLGQIERISLGASISFYLHDIVVALVVGVSVGYVSMQKKSLIKDLPLKNPLILFSVISLFSLAINVSSLTLEQAGVAFLYWLRWTLYACIYFSLNILEKNQKQNLLGALVVSGVVLAILGWVQYFLYPDLRNLVYLGWDPHLYRIFGTFLDPNFLGIYFVITFFLVWDGILFKKFEPRVVVLMFLLITLLFTYSRASYLAFFTGMGVITFFSSSKKAPFALLILLVMSIFFLPRPVGEGVQLLRISTIISRVNNWQEAGRTFLKNPILGVGFNAYHYARDPSSLIVMGSHAISGVDNSFLFLLATVGIFGFSAYIWLLGRMMFINSKTQTVLVPVIISIIVHSFFTNTLFYPFIMLWFWIFVGSVTQRYT